MIIEKEYFEFFRHIFYDMVSYMHKKKIIGKIIWLIYSKTSLKESASLRYSWSQTGK